MLGKALSAGVVELDDVDEADNVYGNATVVMGMDNGELNGELVLQPHAVILGVVSIGSGAGIIGITGVACAPRDGLLKL